MDLNNIVEIDLINKIINYMNFEKDKNKLELKEDTEYKNMIKDFIYSDNIFDFDFYEKYYCHKFKTLNIMNTTDYNIELHANDIKRKIYDTCLFLTELNKIKKYIKYYNLKYYKLLKGFINVNYEGITDYNRLKKILGTIYFKNLFIEKLNSNYKRLYFFFHENQKILKELNDKEKLFEDNIFEIYDKEYKYDRALSSGEEIIYDKILEIYKHTPSLIFFTNEYVLPVKYIGNLRADFFCLVVDKNNCIRKMIIEVNGDQHYKPTKFFYNNFSQNERDTIKKEYCVSNNILFIEITYNQLDKFETIFNDAIYM